MLSPLGLVYFCYSFGYFIDLLRVIYFYFIFVSYYFCFYFYFYLLSLFDPSAIFCVFFYCYFYFLDYFFANINIYLTHYYEIINIKIHNIISYSLISSKKLILSWCNNRPDLIFDNEKVRLACQKSICFAWSEGIRAGVTFA